MPADASAPVSTGNGNPRVTWTLLVAVAGIIVAVATSAVALTTSSRDYVDQQVGRHAAVPLHPGTASVGEVAEVKAVVKQQGEALQGVREDVKVIRAVVERLERRR